MKQKFFNRKTVASQCLAGFGEINPKCQGMIERQFLLRRSSALLH